MRAGKPTARRVARRSEFGRSLCVGALGSTGLLAVLAGVFPVSVERTVVPLVALLLVMRVTRTPMSLLVEIVRRLRWFIVSIATAHMVLVLVSLLREFGGDWRSWIGDGRILLDLVSPGLATAVGLIVAAGWAGWWVRGWPWSVVVLGGAWPAFVLATIAAPARLGAGLARAWLIFWLRVVVVARAWLRYAAARLGRGAHSVVVRTGAVTPPADGSARANQNDARSGASVARAGSAKAARNGQALRPLQRLEQAVGYALDGRDLAGRPIDADPMVRAGLQSIVRLQQAGDGGASGAGGSVSDGGSSAPPRALAARWRAVSWSLRRLHLLALRMEAAAPELRPRQGPGHGPRNDAGHDAGQGSKPGSALGPEAVGAQGAAGVRASGSSATAPESLSGARQMLAIAVLWLTVAGLWLPRMLGG